MKSLLPYFVLILGAILLFRLTEQFSFFADIIGRFWFIITPFITGAVIAYIFNLPCTALQKLILRLEGVPALYQNKYSSAVTRFVLRKSRAFSLLLLIIITILIIVLFLNILIPAIVSNIDMFLDELPQYEATIRGWIYNINEMDLPDFIDDNINEAAILNALLGWAENIDFSAIMGGIISGLGGFATAIFRTFLAIVSSLYLLMEKDKLKAFTIKLIAAVTSCNTNETIIKYSRKLDFNFRKYISAQTIDGIILGSLMTILLFIFGSPYALVLGLILGIVNYIPYFGSIFGTAFAVLVMAFSQGVPTAAFALPFMFVLQQIDGNYIQPRLMGKTFALSPLLIIISVTIGMNYGGILGMLVAIPIVAILKDILDMYITHRQVLKENPPTPVHEDDDFMNRELW